MRVFFSPGLALLCLLVASPLFAQPSGSPLTVTYENESSDFPNPERGLFVDVDLARAADLAQVYADGYTLARAPISLAAFRSGPLSAAFLQDLERGFNAARAAGIKVIPRFTYATAIGDPDAPLSIVLAHIGQLQPLFEAHADVIAVMQAGFIGAWGEWHSSTNELNQAASQAAILQALLDALPADRVVDLRYVEHFVQLVPEPADSAHAFDGSDAARTRVYGDCLLASQHNVGLHLPVDDPEAMAAFLPILGSLGGETCGVTSPPPAPACATALAELGSSRWSYLNADYYASDIEQWKQEGCFGTITRQLGYRYRLLQTSGFTEAEAGATYTLQAELRNGGWGQLYNPRAIELILRHQATGATHVLPADAGTDLRYALPGPQANQTLELTVTLPADLAAGTYDLLLNLPDPALTLRDQPAYSIRLANQGLWEPSTGFNALNRTLDIAGQEAPVLAVGSIEARQPNAQHWHRASLKASFADPVVVAGPLSNNGGNPAVVRVRDVSPAGFDWQIDEYDYLDGSHTEETMAYVAAEAGVHTLADGQVVQAGSAEADGGRWTRVTFVQPFAEAPVVFVQVASVNDERAAVARVRSVETDGFEVLVQREEALAHVKGPETVTWIALETGIGGGAGAPSYEVGRTPVAVTHRSYTLSWTANHTETPTVLATLQTFKGRDPAAVRLRSASEDKAQIWVQEEQSKDTETSHAAEAVGYAAFPAGLVLHGYPMAATRPGQAMLAEVIAPEPMPSTPASRLEAYPNPFNASTRIAYTLDQDADVRLEVYDLLGRRIALLVEGVQSAGTHEATFDGTALPSGLYLARLQASGLVTTQRLMLTK